MRIITVANPRKGVGKTTTVLNIAESLRRRGRKTLVVDMDPQGKTTMNLSPGLEPPAFKRNVFTAMMEQDPMASIIESRQPNIMFMPSSYDLIWLEYEIKKRTHIKECSLLRDALHKIPDGSFDYTLIDTPPSGTPFLYNNSFTTSDYIIIPINSKNRWALTGINKMRELIQNVLEVNPKLEILAALLTHYDLRMNMCRIIRKQAHDIFGDKIFKTIIRTNSVFGKAKSRNMTALEYNRNSNGARDYHDLVTEMLTLLHDYELIEELE